MNTAKSGVELVSKWYMKLQQSHDLLFVLVPIFRLSLFAYSFLLNQHHLTLSNMASTSNAQLKKTLRDTSMIENVPVYLLVMRLTGAGKSTFIKTVTGDDTIKVGEDDDMFGGKSSLKASCSGLIAAVTQWPQDHVLFLRHQDVNFEIHLIDSPGFDDSFANDHEVLERIATFVNTIYKLKCTISGVLYLHDITKCRLGGVGMRNIRMLEEMVGVDKWNFCTLVTTKWGCTNKPEGEEKRELKLRSDKNLFKDMLESAHSAKLARFHGTKGSALQIIKPHLGKKFSPQISREMVDERMALGATAAGRIVQDGLERALKAEKKLKELEVMREVMQQKFDESLFNDFKRKRDKVLTKHRWHRVGRWTVRSVLVGGGIAATVMTLGPGAASFGLVPAFETVVRSQKTHEKNEIDELVHSYQQAVQRNSELKKHGSLWLKSSRVQTLGDLVSQTYALDNTSASTLAKKSSESERSSRDASREPTMSRHTSTKSKLARTDSVDSEASSVDGIGEKLLKM